MPAYRVVVVPRIAERIRRFPPEVKRGIREAMQAIAENPALADALRGELRGYQKYKVGRFRIVYRTDRPSRTIRIMSVGHRRAVYEELAAAVRRREAME